MTESTITEKNKNLVSIYPHMTLLDELKEALSEESLLVERGLDLPYRFRDAVSNEKIRNAIEWTTPRITDLTHTLQIEHHGRLQAIRMDSYSGVPNLKKPVVAGLILEEVMLGKIPRKNITTLIDAGNMNTGFALKYYCQKFGLDGYYIMSGHFPPDMPAVLREPTFEIEQAPTAKDKGKIGVEEEFYHYLYDKMRDPEFRKHKHCLWHAKHSRVLYPLGIEIAENLREAPDYLVVSVGAGSTLGCLLAIQDYFAQSPGKEPKIVVPEHVLSAIFSRIRPFEKSLGVPNNISHDPCMDVYDPDVFRKPPLKARKRIRHSVIGPHYEDPNPLLRPKMIQKIDYVQQYDDDEWKRTSHYLESHGLAVGNSSAAHVSVATNLANMGYSVLTVILEPMRSYYKTEKH